MQAPVRCSVQQHVLKSLQRMKLSCRERREEGATALLRRGGLPIAGLCGVVIFTSVFFTQVTKHEQLPTGLHCQPNGRIRIVPSLSVDEPNPSLYWSRSLFLSPTISLGGFSYSAVRVMDVLWDLVIGRVGQLVLAVFSYPVLRRSLTRRIEHDPVSIPVYTSLAFRQTSPSALWTSACESTKKCFANKKPRLPDRRFLGHALVLLYLLAFPTLAAVATSYQAKYTPYVLHPHNSYLVEASLLKVPPVVVVDGQRVGLHNYQPFYEDDPSLDTFVSCESCILAGRKQFQD